MKKFLPFDWLRAVQFFFRKQCRKELIQCKMKKQTKHSDWSMIKETIKLLLIIILLISNPMIFLVQFGINKHLQIFQSPEIALALRARAILLVFEKFTCAYLFQIALKIM